MLRSSARVYVCSEDERQMLRATGITNVAVAPNGVDLEAVRPTPEPADGDVLFPGDLAYTPNVAAAHWIADEIAPALRRRAPGCRIGAGGRAASPELGAARGGAGGGGRSAGADMREALAGASVVIVPLRSGGGTRLKILEAFGAGRAVVSTALGAEGIEAEHGQHLLIADSAEAVATEVAGLLDDPARRAALGANARALAEERYGWDAIAAALADDLEAVVGP